MLPKYHPKWWCKNRFTMVLSKQSPETNPSLVIYSYVPTKPKGANKGQRDYVCQGYFSSFSLFNFTCNMQLSPKMLDLAIRPPSIIGPGSASSIHSSLLQQKQSAWSGATSTGVVQGLVCGSSAFAKLATQKRSIFGIK